MGDALNVGVIGLGYWGPNILRNFCKAKNSNVIICCDIDRDRYKRIEKIYPWIAYTKKSSEVLENPDIHAVAITTPVSKHYELAKSALESGKHVLISKPITSSLKQAERLVKIAQKNKLVLMVDHTFLYHPAVIKLKDLVSSNELGDLYYIDSVRMNLGLFQHDISVLWDLAPHDISIMLHLIDEPVKWVQATGASHAGQKVESMVYITIQFENGILGHCHLNWLAPVKVRLTTIVGSSKMAVYDDNLVAEKVKVYDSGITVNNNIDDIYKTLIQYRRGDIYSPIIESTEALESEVNHFIKCVNNGVQPLTDGSSSLNIMRIIESAQKSILNNGKRIRVFS